MSTGNATAPSQAEQDADRQLQAKHRALWASGDYPAVAAELIPELGPRLVRACGIRSGQRVLDVAAGSGNAAVTAAAAGADVTASNAAVLVGKLLQLASGAVYDEDGRSTRCIPPSSTTWTR